MVGILVHGDNHLLLRGQLPDREVALAFVRRWSIVEIGAPPSQQQIVTREFRENLQWAAVVASDTAHSPSVTTLLEELSARGIVIQQY